MLGLELERGRVTEAGYVVVAIPAGVALALIGAIAYEVRRRRRRR